MELPRITDLAAKQAIDAIRLFREFVRVQRELQAYEGSLFFKKVGATSTCCTSCTAGFTTGGRGRRPPRRNMQRSMNRSYASRPALIC